MMEKDGPETLPDSTLLDPSDPARQGAHPRGPGSVAVKAQIETTIVYESSALKENTVFQQSTIEMTLLQGTANILFTATTGGSGTPAWIIDDVSLTAK